MQPEWWHWVVGGLALTLAELAIPAFFVIWFGLSAVLVGLLLLLAPELSPTVQVGLWIVVSLGMIVLWFRVFRAPRLQAGERSTRVGGEAIGAEGVLSEAIPPFGKGRARFREPVLGSSEWICLADAEIPAGSKVEVVSIEGNYLKVVQR